MDLILNYACFRLTSIHRAQLHYVIGFFMVYSAVFTIEKFIDALQRQAIMATKLYFVHSLNHMG